MGALDVFGLPDAEEVPAHGQHLEAFRAMQKLYADRVKALRKRRGAARVLDFGTGRNGVARTILEPQMAQGDMLGLYDPHAAVEPPRGKTGSHSRIVGAEEAYAAHGQPYGMVSMSYVMCMMETAQAVEEIIRLRDAHSLAEFVVVDYMLKGREHLADLLDSNEESRWRGKMGNMEFIRTHTRFDIQAFCRLLWDARLPCTPADAVCLDPYGMRAAFVIPPMEEDFAAW